MANNTTSCHMVDNMFGITVGITVDDTVDGMIENTVDKL